METEPLFQHWSAFEEPDHFRSAAVIIMMTNHGASGGSEPCSAARGAAGETKPHSASA